MNRSSGFYKQIRQDIEHGLLKRSLKFIPVIIFALIFSIEFIQIMNLSRVMGNAVGEPSYGDYLYHFFKGMEIYDPTQDERFRMPVIWLAFNVYLFYLIGYFISNDLNKFGQQRLVRLSKRWHWWVSKCIWSSTVVLVSYMIIYFTTFVFAIFTGGLSIKPTESVSGIEAGIFGEVRFYAVFIVMPILTSICIALLQMVIELLTEPVIGYIVPIIILVVSAYYCNPQIPPGL